MKSVLYGLCSGQFIQNNLNSGLPVLGNTWYSLVISCLDGTQNKSTEMKKKQRQGVEIETIFVFVAWLLRD